MRHKTISVDFKTKRVTNVQEIEFVPAMETVRNGFANLFGMVTRPLAFNEGKSQDPMALSRVDKALSELRQQLAEVDLQLDEAQLYNLQAYQANPKKMGNEALERAAQLRQIEEFIKEQVELLEALAKDYSGINVRK